jgi:hypothetical protein
MKYCVIKGTCKEIDGSDNIVEVMLQNAKNKGFLESDVEILTEEEYQTRKVNETKLLQEPTLKERISALEILELERMFNS